MPKRKEGFERRKLTAAFCETAPVGDHYDDGCPGLLLRSRRRNKVWSFCYRFDGKSRKLLLGYFGRPENNLVNLEAARRKANKARALIQDDDNPRDPFFEREKKKAISVIAAKRTGLTFPQLADKYISEWAEPRKRTWKRDRRYLDRQVLTKWGNLPANEIQPEHVEELLQSVGGKVFPIRIRALLFQVFKWARIKRHVMSNPVEYTLPPFPEPEPDDRTATDEEIRQLWEIGDSVVKLILCTGQRPNEVQNWQIAEIDFEKRVWEIPKERSKNKRPHRIWLSDAVMEILRGLPESTTRPGHYFIKDPRDLKDVSVPNPESKNPKIKFLTRQHLRATVATRMAEMGTIPEETISRVLNHSERNGGKGAAVTRKHYQKYTFDVEKREALQLWDVELRRILAS